MIGATPWLTGAALQLIGTTLRYSTPQTIGAALLVTGAALQLIGTTIFFDIPPLR